MSIFLIFSALVFHKVFCIDRFVTLDNDHKTQKLIKWLFKDYNSIVRPVHYAEEPLNVSIEVKLYKLIKMDGASYKLTSQYWVKQKWINHLLKWNASQYKGIEMLQIHSHLVWTPDIVLYNDMDENMVFRAKKRSPFITIYSNGTNIWKYPVIYNSSCMVDITYFPFDHQNCQLKFGSWTYSSDKIKLISEDLVKSDDYEESQEWHLLHIRQKTNTVKYKDGTYYDDMTVTLELARVWKSHIFFVMAPCIVILSTTTFSFSVPSECSERITILVTNLIAFVYFFEMTSETLPHSSDTVPMLTKFYIVLLAHSCISLVVSCFALVIYHKGEMTAQTSVPSIIHKLLLKLYEYKYKNVKNEAMRHLPLMMKRKISLGEHFLPLLISRASKENKEPLDISKTIETLENCEFSRFVDISSPSKKSDHEMELLKDICVEVAFLKAYRLQCNETKMIENEWRLLSRTFDVLYFCFFCFSMTFSTLYICFSSYSNRSIHFDVV